MKKNIVVFSVMMSLSVLLMGQSVAVFAQKAVNSVFVDVIEGDTYFEALQYLKDEGIVSGYPDGTFRPFQTINRAEFTKIIVGATGYNPAQNPSGYDIFALIGVPFSDVEDGSWYVPYLREAKDNAMIDGYPDGSFKPAQEINFVEAAKIVVNGMGYQTVEQEGTDWYKKFVDVLTVKKAIPQSINSFDQKITRGEMSEMIYRLKSGNTYGAVQTYDDLAEPKGYLEGSLSYPSEFIPENMQICANNAATGKDYCTYQQIKDQKYLYGVGYKLPVPAGTYEIMAVVGSSFGGYSQFVTCGMDVNNCASHDLEQVAVKVGQTIRDLDIMDWYYLGSLETTEPEEEMVQENFSPLDPIAWTSLDSVMQGLNAYELVNWGIVTDASADRGYFSTSEYVIDGSAVTLRAYACPISIDQCDEPQLLWEQHYLTGEFDQLDAIGSYLPTMSLVGWMEEGGNSVGSLVFAFKDIDSADSFCADPLIVAMDGYNGRGFGVLDLSTKTMSFGNYEPSQMAYDSAEIRQIQCETLSEGASG